MERQLEEVTLGPKYRGFDDVLLAIIRAITGILLVAMFIVIIMEVIFRYLLGSGVFWTEELARYVMFYMVLVGSAAAAREQRHPALTFVVEKLPLRFRTKWILVIDALVFLVLIAVFKEGYLMAVDERIMKTTALRISFFWVFLALPVGALLMMFEIVAKHAFRKKVLGENDENVCR